MNTNNAEYLGAKLDDLLVLNVVHAVRLTGQQAAKQHLQVTLEST